MNIRHFVIVVICLVGSVSVRAQSAQEEALRKLRLYSLESADPVLRGMRSLKAGFVDPSAAAARQDEIKRIIEELKSDPHNDPKHILKEIGRENDVDAKEEAQKEIDALKWQNTLLTDPKNPIGLYKADFIKTGLLAAEIVADVKLYRELTRRRIEHIVTSMLSDVDMFIALLKRVNESEMRYEERMASMSTFAQMFTDQARGRDILLNPLRRYLVENHSLVKGYMPFNRETIVPLAGRWLLEKGFDWVENQLLVPSVFSDASMKTYRGSFKKMMNLRLQENLDARRLAFQPNQAGSLVALKPEDTPFSVTTGLKALLFLVNPAKSLQKLMYTDTSNPWIGRLWFANKVAGLGLPEFLFSDPVRLGLEIMGIGYSAKFYDGINTNKWGTYVLQNRDELLRILYGYRRALDNAAGSEVAIAEGKQAIREFVEKGHESTSWLPGSSLSEWWTVRDEGRNHVHRWLAYGTVTLLALKLGHWWFTRDAQAEA